MTYGEQAIKYKDSLYLENGIYKASEPPPHECDRLPISERGDYYNAKLEKCWAKMRKMPSQTFIKELRIRLKEHERESKETIAEILSLCDRALTNQNLYKTKEFIEKIKEVINE